MVARDLGMRTPSPTQARYTERRPFDEPTILFPPKRQWNRPTRVEQ